MSRRLLVEARADLALMNSSGLLARPGCFGFRYIEGAGKGGQVVLNGQVRVQVVFLLADTNAGLNGAKLSGNIKAEYQPFSLFFRYRICLMPGFRCSFLLMVS
ncbi:MAG: hypothetical protein ACMUIA_02690 [bacterium]